MEFDNRKETGAYYTPAHVVAALVKWAVGRSTDRMLDPSCGDGRFLALHRSSAGVEQDRNALGLAMARAPWAMIHEGEFFTWARETSERFECAAGNPPFIRYQRFSGDVRQRALALCESLGAKFSSLTSSWAPFLVATASLLKPGGRMAFVVPAEIGHAPYAIPLLKYLTRNFAVVQLIAVRNKIFTHLSEDCWILYTEGFGTSTDYFRLTLRDDFLYAEVLPSDFKCVSLSEWRRWSCRLRPFLMPSSIRALYRELADNPGTMRLGDVARVGIGYVTGANDFFHLRPSQATEIGIPKSYLHPSVRSGRKLTAIAVTHATVRAWLRRNEPVLLLRIQKGQSLTESVRHYLATPEAEEARRAYKCRNRNPWYVVPDVYIPDAFLSYMSGGKLALVANQAKCVCTNSVHAVTLKTALSVRSLQRRWNHPLTQLSCEVEGHPLGGGILKVEPREAANVTLGNESLFPPHGEALLEEGISIMRSWRHHA